MPWTFAHPIAVLPLKKATPKYLDFPALVVGSLSPDACYYLRWEIGAITHSFWGSIVICLPFGIALLGVYYGLRGPVCWLLPRRHRMALLNLAQPFGPKWSIALSLRIAGSIILGAWTHIIWDAFTHKSGLFVQALPLLRADLFLSIPVYSWFQQISSTTGAFLLIWFYARWLRHLRHNPAPPGDSDHWRFLLWGTAGIMSISAGTVMAIKSITGFDGGYALRAFLFQFAVYSTTALALLITACALFLAVKRRQ